MTADEVEVLDATVKLWNAWIKLPNIHPDDNDEFRYKLHDLQRMIMARPTFRRLSEFETEEITR